MQDFGEGSVFTKGGVLCEETFSIYLFLGEALYLYKRGYAESSGGMFLQLQRYTDGWSVDDPPILSIGGE